MTKFMLASLAAVAVSAAAGSAHAAQTKLDGTVADVFGHRFVLESSGTKTLVDLGPKSKNTIVIKTGDKVSIVGESRDGSEIRAERITLPDGRTLETGKKDQSWTEWLMGPDKHAEGPFGPDEVRKIATDAGYAVTGEPQPEKKHFRVAATKDGKTYDLDVHRDGHIKQDTTFGAADARKVVTDGGYEIVGEPRAEKKHFELLGKKDGQYFEVHAHRNGELKGIRAVDKTDSKWGSQVQ